MRRIGHAEDPAGHKTLGAKTSQREDAKTSKNVKQPAKRAQKPRKGNFCLLATTPSHALDLRACDSPRHTVLSRTLISRRCTCSHIMGRLALATSN
eukprot:4823483-Amphidinium_carterae.1